MSVAPVDQIDQPEPRQLCNLYAYTLTYGCDPVPLHRSYSDVPRPLFANISGDPGSWSMIPALDKLDYQDPEPNV
jgi:hypothetical protein